MARQTQRSTTFAESSRVLVTLDLDFANPLVFDPRTTSGVAVLRLSRSPVPSELADATALLLVALRVNKIAGSLWIVHPTRVRVWSPPEDEPSSAGKKFKSWSVSSTTLWLVSEAGGGAETAGFYTSSTGLLPGGWPTTGPRPTTPDPGKGSCRLPVACRLSDWSNAGCRWM